MPFTREEIEKRLKAVSKETNPHGKAHDIHARLQNDSRRAGEFFWTAERNGQFDTTSNHICWARMADAVDLCPALEVFEYVKKSRPVAHPNFDWGIPGWNKYLRAIVLAALKHDPSVFTARWTELEGAVHDGVAVALFESGLLPAEQVPESVLPRFTEQYLTRYDRAEEPFALRHKLWSEETWWKAVAATASMPRTSISARRARPAVAYATLRQKVGIALNGATEAELHAIRQNALEIFDALGAEALPFLEQEGVAALAELASDQYSRLTGRFLIVTLALARLLPTVGRTLDPKYDALLVRDLKYGGLDDLRLSREALATLPPERFEKIALEALKVGSYFEPRATAVLAPMATPALLEHITQWLLSQAPKSYSNHYFQQGIAFYARVGAAAGPYLLRGLEAPKHAYVFARALRSVPHPPAIPALAKLVETGKSDARAGAIEGLAGQGDAALEAVDTLLASKKAAVREGGAAVLLAMAPSPAVVALASKYAAREATDPVRHVLNTVVRSGNEVPLPPVGLEAQSLLEAVPAERRDAVRTLLEDTLLERWSTFDAPEPGLLVLAGEVYAQGVTDDGRPDESFHNRWLKILGDRIEHPVAAWCAVRSLCAVAERRVGIAQLFAVYLDPRPECGYGWWKQLDEDARRRIADNWFFERYRPLVQRHAETMRAHLIAPMVYFARTTRAPHRVYLFEWLAEHAPQQGLDAFVHGLSDLDGKVRAQCVAALRAQGAEVVAKVLPLLADPVGVVRAAAAEVLEAHASEELVAPLKAALAKEQNDEVTAKLDAALARCTGPRAQTEGTESASGSAATPASGAAEEAALDARLAASKAVKLPKALNGFVAPTVRWKGGAAMSDKAVAWLLSRLGMENAETRVTELWEVRARLDDGDALALCDAIRTHCASSTDPLVLFQQAVLGDDARMDVLGSDVQRTYDARQYKWAQLMLGALGRSGRPAAVRWLDELARHSPSQKLRTGAEQTLAALVDERRTERGTLVDESVATHGFDADGTLTVVFGDQSVRLRLEEGGEVLVLDPAGKTRKSLPKGSSPDAEKQFEALRKAVGKTVARERGRFEEAMITGRRWTVAQWRALFTEQPVVRGFRSRLLFTAFDGKGAVIGSFRLEPSGPAVDASGAPLDLERAEHIGLTHPAELSEAALASWRKAFEVAKIEQPFLQLARPAFRRVDGKAPLEDLLAEGTPISSRKLVRALGTLGFFTGAAQDAGMVYEAARWFEARYALELHHDGYPIQTRSLSASDTTCLREIGFQDKGRTIESSKVPAGLYSEAVSLAKQLIEG